MALTQTQVSQLYVAIFNRASEGEGNKYWIGQNKSVADTATAMLATGAAKEYFGTSLNTNQAFVEHIYKNTFNKTIAEDSAGIAYWVGQLNSGKSQGEVIEAIIVAAQLPSNAGSAQTQFNNRTDVSNFYANSIEKAPSNLATSKFDAAGLNVTDSAASVTNAKTKITEEATSGKDGVTSFLKVGQDNVTGTADNDTFKSFVSQNDNGQQVNTLGSGDIINGGAGKDTLEAQITAGAWVNGTDANTMAISPITTSVENVVLTAEMSSVGTTQDKVYVNGRYMDGVEKIASNYSNADLIVQNMTTKGVSGTAAQTVQFSYSGNKDTSWNEADMTVFYDQDYLVRSAVQTNSVYYFTQDRLATNEDNKVFGEKTAVDGIAFTASGLGRVEIKIPEASLEAFLKTVPADSIQAYQGFVALLKTALDAKNTELNGALNNYDIKLNTDYFRTNGGVSNSGDPLKTNAYAIELLVPSGVTVTDPAMSQRTKTLPTYDMFNDVTKVPPTTTDVAVKINVDLEKVGLAADGGALIIGSMNKDAGNIFNTKQAITTTKTVAGFDEFNVHVSGDKSKNSSLSKLISTDNTLRKVTIDSKAGSTANLTIGNSNTGTLGTSTQNAAAFKDVQVMDASSFAGDLKLYAGFTNELQAKYFDNADSKSGVYTTLYGLNVAKTELALFSYKGGAGNDTLNLAFDSANFGYSFGQADMTAGSVASVSNANGAKNIFANVFKTVVEGGAGNDTINITLDATTAASAYVLGGTNMTINGGAGNDTINIATGSGTTTVGAVSTATAAASSFTVAFNSSFGHDIINGFQVSGAAGATTTNQANKTEEVQSLDLTGFVAHAGETVVVTVGDKTYSYTLKTAETTADALTFITDVLTANTVAGTNNNVNLTEAYFTTAALTAGANTLIGNTVTAGAKNGYADKNVGTVKVEIATGSETNVNFEKVAPLHSYTADTIQQGGILWYGNATAGVEAGNGADFLDFTAYGAKGVIMVDNNGSGNKITATGTTTAVNDKLVFLVESLHDAGVYNAYTATVQTAGQTDFSITTGVNALQNKTLLGSIDLGRDVNTGTATIDINADQFLF